MYIPDNIKTAIYEMFSCDGMLEHMACYQYYYDDLKECTFIVFSENEGSKLPDKLCTNYNNKFAIINLGCANRYYAVNEEIYKEMIMTGKSDYYIDLCVELDTQAVSYLKDIFNEKNLITDYTRIEELIQYLQLPEVNYSCIPYLVENAAKKDRIDLIECYKNMKSYMLFKSINYPKLLKNGICEYNRSLIDIQIEADSLYNDMLSEQFFEYYKDYIEMQKSIYVLLIKAICIEFSNSKRSEKNKVLDLLDFINRKLGFVAERELEICYFYFAHHEKAKKFFKRVQKNSPVILDTVNGMAWDLVHIRLIEKEFMTKLREDVRYAIHMFLTFDNGLKEILQINPVEKIALYNGAAIPKLKNQWIDMIPGALEKIYKKENMVLRNKTFETRNVEMLRSELEEELISFCRKI